MKGALPEFWSFNRSRDESLIKTEVLQWRGPFSWMGFEQANKLEPTPDISGVYLFTFEYKDGYILRSAGVTNSMKRRFSQHTREYTIGNYTVLDVEYARNGIRKEIWHGWGYAKEHRDEFSRHKDYILQFVKKSLRLIDYSSPKLRTKEKEKELNLL